MDEIFIDMALTLLLILHRSSSILPLETSVWRTYQFKMRTAVRAWTPLRLCKHRTMYIFYKQKDIWSTSFYCLCLKAPDYSLKVSWLITWTVNDISAFITKSNYECEAEYMHFCIHAQKKKSSCLYLLFSDLICVYLWFFRSYIWRFYFFNLFIGCCLQPEY